MIDIARQFKWEQHEIKKLAAQIDYRFRKHETEVFQQGGTPGGSRFVPLSAKYAKWKKRHFPGKKILSLTGKLKKSLANKGPQHVAFGIVQPRPSVTIGTRNRLAAFHGPGRLHNKNLPVRDAMLHKPRNEAKYFDIVAEFLTERTKRIMRASLAQWKATGGR